MDTGTNNIASSSSHTQTIDNTTEPTETTRLLAGHDKTHEAIGDVEDPSLEPTNNDDDDDDPRDARKDRPNPIRNKLSKERIKYASLFAIPVFLLVPSLVFFVMTLNLRATLPPSSSLETIANLTRRVSYLSKSLSACNDNTTQLATELHDERQRVEICRENEKRLAERVDIVQEMLEQCQTEENVLKKNLEDAQNDLSVCHDEKEELKRQMESGVFIQFLDMVGKMGTGGDSWVCSDQTESWSHGFTTTDAPHPTITIQTWTSELRDVEHSAVPLIFPPVSLTSISDSTPSQPFPSFQSTLQRRRIPSSYSRSLQTEQASAPRIIGYTVSSGNRSGNNGWWRINKLPFFAVEGGKLEFFALAAKWYGSAAKFQVTVYWVETK